MKVICIEDKFYWAFQTRSDKPIDPKFGEICTVINQMQYLEFLLYKLDGYSEWYNSKKFVPVSEINEKEFERNYKKELV